MQVGKGRTGRVRIRPSSRHRATVSAAANQQCVRRLNLLLLLQLLSVGLFLFGSHARPGAPRVNAALPTVRGSAFDV